MGLTNFQAEDLTFVSTEDGWALGSADCLSGGGICTALVRTTDGGRTWHSMKAPSVNLPNVHSCAAPCVNGIRFANQEIGYAFGVHSS